MTIFRDAADLYWFCDKLRELKEEFGVELYTFCLMSNHLHMLLRQGQMALGKFMKRLLCPYAMRFNRKYAHTGHVFEGRYYSNPVLDDRYFLTALRYIARNPIEARMVQRAGDWKFSGHRELAGTPNLGLVDTAFPLAAFHGEDSVARRDYSSFVEQAPALRPWQVALRERFARDGFLMEDMAGQKRGLGASVRYEAIVAALDAGATSKELCAELQCSPATLARAKDRVLENSRAQGETWLSPEALGERELA